MRKLLILLSLFLLLAQPILAQDNQNTDQDSDEDVPALYTTLTQVPDWLNTSRALTPADLKGRVLLVDFWTYCCINCLHVMPKLKTLEQEFGDQLTVIGVHSAKFANESDTDNIREAIQKYDLRHPVVNDADFLIWNAFGINAWPTLLLIGPDGLLKQVYRGEGNVEDIRRDIKDLLRKYDGHVTTAPLPIALERDKEPATILRFPTKLSAKDDHTLVIADSGHQRIVIVNLNSKKIIQTIGSGLAGNKDGTLDQAQFNNPQGVLADRNVIFVADTGNHSLRQIDLASGHVSTLSGNGRRGTPLLPNQDETAKRTSLASPWALAFYPDVKHIAIANAGTHQIWIYDRNTKMLNLLAGNGQESIEDGTLPYNALAQTSGLSVRDNQLYFADAETSSLRVYQDGQVTTLIGSGLFDFGLKDGQRDKALMQHPIGVYADTDRIYVADTYNHKIRLFKDARLSTLKIDSLKEPNDILRIGDLFYIADTNNHRIEMMKPNGHDAGTLDIMPMEKPVVFQDRLPNPIQLAADIAMPATVTLNLPKHWHVNPQAPSYLVLFDEDRKTVASFKAADLQDGPISLPDLQPNKHYTLQGIIYYCAEKAGSQCLIRGVQVDLKTSDAPDAAHDVGITLP